MEYVHQEQGLTAVDYTDKDQWINSSDNGTQADQAATAMSDTHSEVRNSVVNFGAKLHITISPFEDIVILKDLPDPEPRPGDVNDNREWSRRSDESLFVGDPCYLDIAQGTSNDCSFMASLASVAEHNPGFIREMITDNHDGTYTVRLFNSSGEAEYITVDGQLYRDQNGNPIYAQNDNRQVIWPAIVEKAFAMMKGGYENLEFLNSTETLRAITGLEYATQYNLKEGTMTNDSGTFSNEASPNQIFNWISFSLEQGRPVTAGTHDPGEGVVYDENNQLVVDHAYSVVRTYEEEGEQWVVLFNPWGNYEYQTDSYVNNGINPDDGVFRMTIDDFIAMYEHLYIAS
jgi:hypothetical protein